MIHKRLPFFLWLLSSLNHASPLESAYPSAKPKFLYKRVVLPFTNNMLSGSSPNSSIITRDGQKWHFPLNTSVINNNTKATRKKVGVFTARCPAQFCGFGSGSFSFVFVTTVRSCVMRVMPGLFFCQMSFSCVSIFFQGWHFRSISKKKKNMPGKTRLDWRMNNAAVSKCHFQLRKFGRCVTDLLFWHGLGWLTS